MSKLPTVDETDLHPREYNQLKQSPEGRRIIIESANAKAERRMERETRKGKR